MAEDEQRLAEEARKSREETEELKEESGSDEGGNPWAKTSSGDADNVIDDE